MTHNRFSDFHCFYTIIQVVHTEFSKSCSYRLFTEAVVCRCSVKKVFLKMSQNSQENACARVSLLINLQMICIQPSRVQEISFKYKLQRVKPWYKRRKKFGFYETMLAELQLEDKYNHKILLKYVF